MAPMPKRSAPQRRRTQVRAAATFRRIALGLRGAVEGVHKGHTAFRAGGRIFATIRSDGLWGTVKLSPEHQEEFVRENSSAFMPEVGAWGRGGYTAVRLDAVDEDTLGAALTLARQDAELRSAKKRR